MIEISSPRLFDLSILPLDTSDEETMAFLTETAKAFHNGEEPEKPIEDMSYKQLLWLLQICSDLDYAEECSLLETLIATKPMDMKIMEALTNEEREERFIDRIILTISNPDLEEVECRLVNEFDYDTLKERVIRYCGVPDDIYSNSDSDIDPDFLTMTCDGKSLLLDIGIGMTSFMDLHPFLQFTINSMKWTMTDNTNKTVTEI